MSRSWHLSSALFGALLLCSCADPSTTTTAADAPAPRPDVYATHTRASGLPSFAWLSGVPAGATAEKSAANALAVIGSRFGVSAAALRGAELRAIHDPGEGAIIAQYTQRHDGIEVFQSGFSIAMDRSLVPVSASGTLSPHLRPSGDFGADARPAIAAAYRQMTGAVLGGALSAGRPEEGGFASYALPPRPGANLAAGEARARKVWFQRAGLRAAWYVESLDVGGAGVTDSRLESFVVTARGEVLFRHNLISADSYRYRVWADAGPRFTPWDSPWGNDITPHPTGRRDGSAPTPQLSSLVRLQNVPFSRNDPWLPRGATEAVGNNVRVYADLMAPDGFGMGDLNLPLSGPGAFDYPYDPLVPPTVSPWARRAVLTQLFYTLNFLHDSFYDAGWDEASFNPQQDNYGRGGTGADPIRGEAQDYGGRNNANASTPADGRSPRIQMYLWDDIESHFEVLAPPPLAGDKDARGASFGPSAFDVSGDAVVARDAGGAAMEPLDVCEAVDNGAEVNGKIAIIARGNCPFVQKVLNAQAAGATAVVITNNVPGGPPGLGGTAPMPITIPAMGLSKDNGDLLRAALLGGAVVRLRLRIVRRPDRDSSLDTTIVAHEWGHVLTNRLVGNSSGLSTQQAGAMGEGWGDFVALMTILRPEDAMTPAGATWAGVYPSASPTYRSEDRWYDGDRRYPYSTDMSKNPLTLKHIQDGVALPAAPRPAFGADGSNNSEVHSSGEVWASMLWECYAGLLRERRQPFHTINRRMRQYLVASLKLTPSGPTILEGRDALLAAIAAGRDRSDYEICWRAMARRGAGVGATGPGPESQDNGPVVESFLLGNDLTFLGAELDDAVGGAGRCDGDGVLDGGETDRLRLRIRNTGSGRLRDTQVRVSSDNPAVTFPGGAVLRFREVGPFAEGAVELDVRMAPAMAVAPYTLTLTFTDPELARPRIITTQVRRIGNYDVVPAAATTDEVIGLNTPWTVAGDAALDETERWHIRMENDEGQWHITDSAAPSDQYLVPPPLTVTGDLSFTFRHRHSFESSGGNNYDGGVLELSADGGMTWTDLGDRITSNGYGAVPIFRLNPVLGGRRGFVGASAGFPDAYLTSEVRLGMGYVGRQVQVRFRVGTDEGVGGPGWDVDEVAFVGIGGTPFPKRVPHRGLCGMAALGEREVATASSALSGGEGASQGCQAGGGGASSSGLLFLATLLALKPGRRRRAA